MIFHSVFLHQHTLLLRFNMLSSYFASMTFFGFVLSFWICRVAIMLTFVPVLLIRQLSAYSTMAPAEIIICILGLLSIAMIAVDNIGLWKRMLIRNSKTLANKQSASQKKAQ